MTILRSAMRRRFLSAASCMTVLGTMPTIARATYQTMSPSKSLAMDHTHTREKIELIYAVGPEYLPKALTDLNHFLRDHYSGHIGTMDAGLYDIMHSLRAALKVRTSFEIISGYRSPKTNERLRTTRGGGVARRSLHMDGKAVDLRLPGVPLDELHAVALSLKAGGVGYYPGSNFVHVDTGRVRSWHG